MKQLFIAALLFISSITSANRGQAEAFLNCAGYHHGSYVDFHQDEEGKAFLRTSDDSGMWTQDYMITRFEKNRAAVPKQQQVELIKEIGGMMTSGTDDSFPFVYIEGKSSEGSEIILNMLNHFEHSYVVTDGFVEPLECFSK